MFNIKDNGWILCPSKRFPGKYYYFNVLNGEAAWCVTEFKKPTTKKNEEIPNIIDTSHNYPEPTSPPDTVKFGSTYPNITHEFGQAVFPKYVPFTPNISWRPISTFTSNIKTTEDKITQTETQHVPNTECYTKYRTPVTNFKDNDVQINVSTNTPTFGICNYKHLIKDPVLKFSTPLTKKQSNNIFLQDTTNTSNPFFKSNIENTDFGNLSKSFVELNKTPKKNESFEASCSKDLSKLGSNDLRLLLVARKRRTSEKEMQPFLSDNKFKLPEEQSATPKKIRFNLDQGYDDDDDIQTQNMVWNLSNLFLEDEKNYVLVDIETLLDKLSVIEDYIVADQKRRLLIPMAMKIEIEAFSRVNSRDIQLVHAARKFVRTLATQTQFVVLQNSREEHFNMSTNAIVLNYCIDIGQKAILITNNNNLQKRAEKLKIKCFNTQHIEDSSESAHTIDWDLDLTKDIPQCDVTPQIDKQLTVTDDNNNRKMTEKIKDNCIENKDYRLRSEDRLNNFTDNILKRFCVSSNVIDTRLKSRSDEMICCFNQIMENAVMNVIQPHNEQPYNLLEALIRLQNNCSDKTISNIIQKLKELLKKNSCEKGTINKDINIDDFMKIIGCGVVLLENLKTYYSNLELKDACESMNYLVNNIVDPNTDTDIVSEIIIAETKIETREVVEKKIYRRDPNEILNYVTKHYHPNLRDDTKENEAEKIPENPKIFRTVGKNLNLVKIDGKNNLTMSINNKRTINNGNTQAGPVLPTQEKSIDRKSIKTKIDITNADAISVGIADSGIENDSYQSYSLAKTFFYELSTTFIEVHDFIKEANFLIQKNNMDDALKKEINAKVKKTLEYVEKVTEKLKRIIEREDDENKSIRHYILKAGVEATSDRRMVKYGQVIKKCLEQWSYSQTALKIMLALTDLIYKETISLDDTSLSSVRYINIFE